MRFPTPRASSESRVSARFTALLSRSRRILASLATCASTTFGSKA